ncbi:MAG TPA: TIGR03089 family protein [Micromonosporaceae bacterium]|nr:TIGR03089 family protein [Micromonosporaceae bacterium]
MADTVGGMFAAAVAADPTRPLLTWYDDRTGERTELSGASLDNWVAKTANLLVGGLGLGVGDRVGVLLPPHWQTAAVLLGSWSAGLTVSVKPRDVEVLFAAAGRADKAAGWPAGDRYALALAPLAAPLRTVPAGFADYVVEVRTHGDRFTPYAPVSGADMATASGPKTHAELCLAAVERAAALGIGAGRRVLIDANAHPDPIDWLLAPLAAGASIVLCGHMDPGKLADRAAAERVTVILT